MATEATRKAVRTAYEYLLKVSPSPTLFTNFRLEEIILEKNGDFLITLSYDAQGEFAFDKKREFKVFKVDKSGKSVISMKIRKI